MSFILLLTLSSRVPARVLLPSVICANRMRPGLVQKQRSLIFILPSKIGDVWAQSKCSFHRRWAGLFCWDLISGEGAAAVLLLPRLRCRASLHTPAATILYWGVCADGPLPPSWVPVSCAALEVRFPLLTIGRRNSGLQCRVWDLCPWHPVSQWNSLSTREMRRKKNLDSITQVLF